MDINLTEEEKIKVLNSDDLYSVMQRILLRQDKIDRTKENFWTVGLDVKNAILYIELISMGGTSMTVVEPMQVFRVGVLKGAVKMILVHNHPSGELKPSEADKDITDRLIQVGNILQIEVVDHLIIAEKTYMSFLDIGLHDQLKLSTKYVPAYELEARIRREARALGEEEGAKNRNKEIAKQMKSKGYSLGEISELTGLTEEQIRKLK
jgi:DNA repair protein RadC